jgi:hypothetical protein
MLKIDAKLAELRAALETEVEASVRAEIANQISTLEATNSFLAASKKGKGNETDRGDPSKDDDDDDSDEDEDEEGDDEACKSAKAKARKAKAKSKSADSEEAKSKAKASYYAAMAEVHAAKAKKAAKRQDDDEEEDDEEAKATLAALYQATGKRGQGAIGALAALVSKASQYDAVARDVAALKAKNEADARSATIAAALQARRITPGEAKSLAGKRADYVAAYLDARPQALVSVEETVFAPKSDLSAIVIPSADQKHIDFAVCAVPEGMRAAVRTELETAARERIAKTTGGRY